MKINYDLKFKEELEKIKGTKPSLLLHVCCGPCSGNVLKEISEFFDITIYYSNSKKILFNALIKILIKIFKLSKKNINLKNI